jgi:glycolate oxidase FAD binding subunit
MRASAPATVIEPANEAELARELASAAAAGLHVIPRGGGTKLDWGHPPAAADLVLSTRRLDRVVEHAAGDMTVTVQSGCTIAALQDILARGGQRLALDPLWPSRATVGGVLATNDSGPLRAAYGSLRDLVIGITVALPDGTLARSGGKVVKNVAGYDLPKLMVGAFGTLGVITEATFRLHPLPRAAQCFSFTAPTFEAMNRLVLAVHDSPLTYTGVQVIAGRDVNTTVSIRIEGSPESVDAQAARVVDLARTCGTAPVADKGAWDERESLWEATDAAAVCKVTVLPARLADLCDAMERAAPPRAAWRAVIQSVGVALLRTSAPESLRPLRQGVQQLGGSLVLLRCAPALKHSLGVWGAPTDAWRLMDHVRNQFDPSRTLNPGRFVG